MAPRAPAAKVCPIVHELLGNTGVGKKVQLVPGEESVQSYLVCPSNFMSLGATEKRWDVACSELLRG
jgi:hypothetical protein